MGINNNRKRVLLFSSGLDSFIIKNLLKFEDNECLFLILGTKENKIEEKFISNFYSEVQKIDFPISRFSLPNHIIPYRNHLMALIAANYGNEIHFGFTAGDTTKDKDYVFKSQIEGILNYFSLDRDKVFINGRFEIDMRFKTSTKTEMVAFYLSEGFPAEKLITHSNSCYEGLEKPCGKCRSCLRKFVALTLNGIECSSAFIVNPFDYLEGLLNESIVKNRNNEINDIRLCLQRKQ